MGQLLFKQCFFDAIRDGTKRTTIRRWSNARLKPGQRALAPGVGWLIIEDVRMVDLKRLKNADAVADGFESLDEMRQVLARLYPAAETNLDGRQWFKVSFRRETAREAARHAAHRLKAAPVKSPRVKSIRVEFPARPRKAPASRAPTTPRRAPSSPRDNTAQRRELADALRKTPSMSEK